MKPSPYRQADVKLGTYATGESNPYEVVMKALARTLVGGTSVFGLLATSAFAQSVPQADDSYFLRAQEQLEARLAIQPNTGKAKNVIVFIVDGLSIPTITAARIYQGEQQGLDIAAQSDLSFERLLPHTALVRTYTSDAYVPDSAPTATAITSGIKAPNGTIGVDQTVTLEDCSTQAAATTKSLFEQAEEKGLSTGIITTARITHATPAAAYAHTAGRDWEADKDLPEAAVGTCADIASQLVDWSFGNGFEVAFGGGRGNFMLETQDDPQDASRKGARKDRDLIADWQSRYNNGTYVYDRAGFDAIDVANTDHVLGLFNRSHMQYEADRDETSEPSLAEMTSKAIDMLAKNDEGFVLMVEGGRVDHAHHGGNASRALQDTLAVAEAVQTAFDKIDPNETLIVFTADHSHVFSMAGYPAHGDPILGKAPDLADDGLPYTVLGYQNGPGAAVGEVRADLTSVDTTDVDFLQQALIPLSSETHAGDDVAVFAQGPQAYLFDGVIEQNMIYHVMARALGLDGK